MGVNIKLVLSDQEQIIYHSMNLASLSQQISAKVQTVISTLPELSSEGAFHDLIAASDSNAGLSLYYLKAQEFMTLSEVLYQHAQNTYDKMVDVDKVLATSVANLILDNPDASAEDKEAIRKDPQGSINQIKKNYQSQKNDSKEGGSGS